MTMTTLTLQQEQENTAETDFYADDGNDQPAHHTAETWTPPSWTTPRTTCSDLSGTVNENSSEGEFVVRDEFGVGGTRLFLGGRGRTIASPSYGNPNAL